MGSQAFWEAFALSLLPGLFWLAYLRSLFHKRHRFWWWLVALAFGVASTHLTLFLSDLLGTQGLMDLPVGGTLAYYVLGVGLVEELAKALCAGLGLFLVRGSRDSRSVLLFTGGVALGFATWENVQYALGYGSGVLIGRGLFSTLGHVVMSAVWGAALAKQGGGRRWGRVLWALVIAGLGHGLYNWFLVSGRPPLAILTLIVLWRLFRESTNVTVVQTQYHRAVQVGILCGACGGEAPREANYCTFCGQPTEEFATVSV